MILLLNFAKAAFNTDLNCSNTIKIFDVLKHVFDETLRFNCLSIITTRKIRGRTV